MTIQSDVPKALGEMASEEAVRANMERYRATALELGASDAVLIAASDVPIDERVRLKCVVPRCIRAGETPYCPPHSPDLDLIRRALGRFSWAILVKCNVEPIEDYAPGRGTTKAEQRQVLEQRYQKKIVKPARAKESGKSREDRRDNRERGRG